MALITIRSEPDGGVKVRIRRHEIEMERSPAEGGREGAVSPAEMTVASLGACIGLMVDEYCARNGYRDGLVLVYLHFQMGDSPRRIQSITIDLEIPKDVPEEKKEVIRRIAEHCPVHRTLGVPPQIDLEIV
jgi:putative redox protein